MGEHGGKGNWYTNRDCRCVNCTEQHAAQVKQRRKERKLLLKKDPTRVSHGKPSTYTNWGCRCDACREAHAKYKAEWEQSKKEKT